MANNPENDGQNPTGADQADGSVNQISQQPCYQAESISESISKPSVEPVSWQPQLTADGSFTFFSETFHEAFHSQQGAKQEAFSKYAQATELTSKAQQGQLCLLDVCYGLGYNSAAALETVWAGNPDCQVTLYGLELDLSVPQAAVQPPLLETWSVPVQKILQELAFEQQAITSRLQAKLLIGDARQTILQLVQRSVQANAIFFDPFSPRRCPQLWTVEFFQQVARCLHPDGKLATYSRSAAVRAAMQAVGLEIGTIPLGPDPLPHEWAQGTVAGFNPTGLMPLSTMEQEHLHTRAAVPYRDPDLNQDAETILARQTQEQQRSQLESTSSWRRRWQIY
jgi:tRNA U34 5-methylaminomethyl-2-thiouridine-forming methyltransferase MnmC